MDPPDRVRALAVAAAAALAACAARVPPPATWAAPLHGDHPLVGRIWDVRDERYVSERDLIRVLEHADFVLLGEAHDNPDHHAFEARVIHALSSSRDPALVLEVLRVDQQRLVDAALVGSPTDPDLIAAAVDWSHAGLPDFALYRPLFAAALAVRWPILAGDLAPGNVGRYLEEGDTAFGLTVRRLLEHAGPLPDPVRQRLADELLASHCGQLPPAAVEEIASLQQARDAQLASRLLTADRELSPAGFEQGAVLVAELGHVRTDRGVPRFLAREAPQRSARSVGMLEVSPDRRDPAEYARSLGAATLPFDYVVFTPAAARSDPCESFRRHTPKGSGPVIEVSW